MAFAIAFVLVVALGAAVVAVLAPGHVAPCPPRMRCGAPPTVIKPLVNLQLWRSSQLGFSLEYPGSLHIAQQDGRSVTLVEGDGSQSVIIAGSPAIAVSPAAAINRGLSSLASNISGLSADASSADRLLGTNVGYLQGPGGAYTGALTSPQGAQEVVLVDLLAASNGRLTIAATRVLTGNAADGNAPSIKGGDDQDGDVMFNSIHWP
jgi:hypothetical protein